MGIIDLEAAKEAQRRDRIAVDRRKYVAGSAALKQFTIRFTGVFADALRRHITCSTLSPSDRDVFSLDPAHNETRGTTSELERQGRGNDDRNGDLPSHSQPSLSWLCTFCGKLRSFEGGRPLLFAHRKILAQEDHRARTRPQILR
jgi:hypothetical protein